MEAVQLHLALNHLPVALTLVGFVILLVGTLLTNISVVKTGASCLIAAGIFIAPVYFSGEGAEERIEHMQGVDEDDIEEHEEAALFAAISSGVVAALALIGLIGGLYSPEHSRFKVGLLAASLLSFVVMLRLAHLGGLIRHPELDPAFQAPHQTPPTVVAQ